MIKQLAKTYNLDEIDKRLGGTYWSPIDVAHINDWVLRAAAVFGSFHWHAHEDDEFFLIWRGEITIDTDKGSIHLKQGEGTVIPKGLRHCPKADKRAVVLLLEPKRLNTKGEIQ